MENNNNLQRAAHEVEQEQRLASWASRRFSQLLFWLPTLVLIGTLFFLEKSLFHPFTESFTGLRLNVTNINTEIVFQAALDRANFTNPFHLNLGLQDTELKSVYELDQYGHFITMEDQYPPTPNSNVSQGYEPTTLYNDFPRLLLSNGSPTLLEGQVPVEGPDDVSIPTIPQEIINELFEKALEWKNDMRESALQYDVIMAVIIGLGFLISMIGEIYGILFLVPFLWFIKGFYRYSSRDTQITKVLRNEVLCQIFRNHYQAWGLKIEVFPLAQPGIHDALVNLVVLIGWAAAFVLGVLEIGLYLV